MTFAGFVIALPIYLGVTFQWDHLTVGGFLATWIIGYGVIQSIAPKIIHRSGRPAPDGRAALMWGIMLAVLTASIAFGVQSQWHPEVMIVGGLLLFGAVFAINSSLHSYLIVSYADGDGVSLDVGFYYMANAMGRLIGTVLSGWVFQVWGFTACLWVSCGFLVLNAIISIRLPHNSKNAVYPSKINVKIIWHSRIWK